MRLWLVSTGSGTLARRLSNQPRAASRGAADGSVERWRGSDVHRAEAHLRWGPGGEAFAPGADIATRALGDMEGRDTVSRSRAARVLMARPLVPAARAAVPAVSRGRPEDTRESAQEVNQTVRALVQSSALAARRGAGRGGQPGPSEPALDGTSRGASRALPSGSGAGRGSEIGSDPRFFDYFERLKDSVEWRSAFPRWAIARGLGGVVVTGLTLTPSGRLTSLHIVRSSGFVEFDRNVLDAIREASFPPHPPELSRALGNRPLTVHVAWDATNPAVGREGPGPGQRGAGP
jgi:TonB family protein